MTAASRSPQNCYSLWLSPQGSSRDLLSKNITDISQRLSSAIFDPHITLCSPVKGDKKEFQEKLQQLVSTFSAIPVRLQKFSFAHEFFRCLYIDVAKSPELLTLRKKSLDIFKLHTALPYEPHISLAYKNPDEFDADLLCRELDTTLLSPMTFNRIAMMDTSGQIHQWHEVAGIDIDA